MNDGKMDIEVTCRFCLNRMQLRVDCDGYNEWRAGGLIQKCLPDLPVAHREILISSTCNDCFEKMFPPEEE